MSIGKISSILKAQSTIFQKCHIVWSHGTSTISYKQGKNTVDKQLSVAWNMWHRGWRCSKSVKLVFAGIGLYVCLCIFICHCSQNRECSLSVSARLLRSVYKRKVSPWCWLSCLQFPQQRKIALVVWTWHFSPMPQCDTPLYSKAVEKEDRVIWFDTNCYCDVLPRYLDVK